MEGSLAACETLVSGCRRHLGKSRKALRQATEERHHQCQRAPSLITSLLRRHA